MRREGTSSPNIRIHSGFLVNFLVFLTFRTPGMRSPVMNAERHDDARTGPRRLIAFFAALLFVSHPIQTQVVSYVVQRFASPDTLFYLAAVVSYAGSRLAAMHRRVHGDGKARGRFFQRRLEWKSPVPVTGRNRPAAFRMRAACGFLGDKRI